MTKKELIKALKKYPDDSKIMISERACENVHDLETVDFGWYTCDEDTDISEVIPDTENPDDWGIEPNDVTKVIVFE